MQKVIDLCLDLPQGEDQVDQDEDLELAGKGPPAETRAPVMGRKRLFLDQEEH